MANIWVDNENVGVGLPPISAKKKILTESGSSKQSAKKSVLSKIDNVMHQKQLAGTPLKSAQRQPNCNGANFWSHTRQEPETFKNPGAGTTLKASVLSNTKDIAYDYQDHPDCLTNCKKRIAEHWADNQVPSDDLFHHLLMDFETSNKTAGEMFYIPKQYLFDDEMSKVPDLWDTENRAFYYNLNDDQLNQILPMPDFNIIC